MDRQTTRQVRFYLRMHYPVCVTATADGFRGRFPDLPGCVSENSDLPALYADLEQRRREWITERLLQGDTVPTPNSHLMPPQRQRSTRSLPAAACVNFAAIASAATA